MEGGPSLLLFAGLLHLLAAGAWIGGLWPLLIVVRGPPRVGALAARWFSPLGKACVVGTVLSSAVQFVGLVGGLPGLVGTAYGWVAGAKLGLLGVLFVFAVANRYRLAPALMRQWWTALAALVVGAVAAVGAREALPALAFAAAAFMILGAFAEVVERVRLGRVPVRDSLDRLRGLRLPLFGAALGHAGMGVLVAGVAGMSLSTQSIVLLKPGETAQSAGYTWALDGMRDELGSNYGERIATLRVLRDGKLVTTLEPARRTFPVQRMTTTEAAISTNGFADIYAVLGEERDGAAVLRLHYNPLAPWIWFGALVMAAGGGLSLADRRLRIGAPVRRRAAAVAA